MIKKNILGLIYTSFIFFNACSSIQMKTEPSESAHLQVNGKFFQWEVKALIKNITTGEANILNLDIVGQKPYPVRAEVTSSMGIHLASILILEKEIRFLLPKSKKFYSGSVSPKSLGPILNVELDPRLIVASLFNESYPDWKCEAQEGEITNCETPNHDRIEWFYNKENLSKRVEIKGENYESQLQFKAQKEVINIKENVFVMKAPENYKSYLLKN